MFEPINKLMESFEWHKKLSNFCENFMGKNQNRTKNKLELGWINLMLKIGKNAHKLEKKHENKCDMSINE